MVYTRGIDHKEIWWPGLGRRAGSAAMAELNAKTEFLESRLLEKQAIPELVCSIGGMQSEKEISTHLNTMKGMVPMRNANTSVTP